MQFDLQMFAEAIEGIDADILEEIQAEQTEEANEEPKEEPAKEEPSTEETAPTVEADNVNKQVEEQNNVDEFEDVKEGNTIPYDRFKSVNERRKTAESRIKELEAELKGYKEKQTANVKPEPQVDTEASLYDYTAQQRQEIARMAVKRAKEKLKLTDEDIEAMEYSDDPADKAMYNSAVARETNAIHNEIQQYKAEQRAFNEMTARCADEFEKLNQKLQGYSDAQARWDFIANEQFNKLPQRKQAVINNAFLRLQNKRGTDQDIVLVEEYFDACTKIYDHNHGLTPKNNNNKLNQAQQLPKAPDIVGATGGDTRPLNAERVADILNDPDGWDRLTEKERNLILMGKF